MKRVFLSVLISLFLLAGLTGNNKAHEVAGPKGPVILTITGNIHHNNRGASDMFSDALSAHHDKTFDEAYSFDLAMLKKLKQHKATVHVEGWKKPVMVQGPSLESVLSKAGALGQKFRLTAIDGYSAVISLDELGRRNWILALSQNGKPLGIGGRGPQWLVYDTKAGQASKEEEAKWVWSVFLIEVE